MIWRQRSAQPQLIPQRQETLGTEFNSSKRDVKIPLSRQAAQVGRVRLVLRICVTLGVTRRAVDVGRRFVQ